ncbi:MAG: DNA polymerase IV [Burkholderiaceae bacterium]|nr:DNA polymerase IV [Burkholderiaceae bacterium]
MARWIAHLDMDAFYASVDLLRYPMLAGSPVVIGGARMHAPTPLPEGGYAFARLRDYAGRGVVTTATYEARAFGIRSGMGLMKCAALCPDAVLLPTDFDEYRRHSRAFKDAVAGIAPVIEDRGIDEIYIDLGASGADRSDSGRGIALRIRAAVRAATGLSCSIGLAPNKLLAKIASELDKPDGLTLIAEGDLERRIWPLPASRINGIGPKAAARLAEAGIATIGDLARADRLALVVSFGQSYGHWLHESAHGRDDRPVVTHSEPKSISRETTFERDLHPRRDRDELTAILTQLCDKLAGDLERKGYRARTIGIKLRYDDFSIVTRDRSAAHALRDAPSILAAARDCLRRADLGRRLRLLGVRAAGLVVEPAVDAQAGVHAAFAAPAPGAARAAEPERSAHDAPRRGASASLPLFD